MRQILFKKYRNVILKLGFIIEDFVIISKPFNYKRVVSKKLLLGQMHLYISI